MGGGGLVSTGDSLFECHARADKPVSRGESKPLAIGRGGGGGGGGVETRANIALVNLSRRARTRACTLDGKKKEKKKKGKSNHANDHHVPHRGPRVVTRRFSTGTFATSEPRPAAVRNANSRIGSEISGQTSRGREGGREGAGELF